MKLSIVTAITILASTPAYAQSATATAESQSQSGVYSQGDNVRSSTAVAPSTNSTAPCVIGQSAGIGTGGVGFSIGGGRIDKECVTRREAQILGQIASMRGEQRRATIIHFCRLDKTMQDTMVAMGWCRVVRR